MEIGSRFDEYNSETRELFGAELDYDRLAALPDGTHIIISIFFVGQELEDLDNATVCAKMPEKETDGRRCVPCDDGSRIPYRIRREEMQIPDDPEEDDTYYRIFLMQGKEKARMSEEIVLTEEQRAQTLHRQIVGYGEVICQSLYGMCTAIKQMRDSKLYKALGHSTFESYAQEMLSMTARQAYTYISIADKLSEDFVKSTSQIGIQKLYLLAMASEETRTEIAAHTDLESTTVRELKAQIAALKKQSEQAEKSRTDAEKRAQGWYDRYSEQGEQIASLNAQIAEQSERIDELESRPVEVAVPEPSREVQNLQDAMRRINREHEEWSAKMQDDHIREIQRLHADYRRQMEAMKTDGSAVFPVYLDAAADAVSRLSEWVKSHGDSAAKKQAAEMLRTYWMEITENGGQ